MTALALYLANIVVLPLLLIGLIRKGKARLLNRAGPPLFGPFYDLWRLLRKEEVVSETTTLVFRAAPLVNLAAVLAVALMVPWAGAASPLRGDLFLAIYLLALGRFAVGLAALDAGSAFGGLGASRESTVSIQAEPAMVCAFVALAARAHSSSFQAMFAASPADGLGLVLVPLVLVALWLATMAELARMPVDDPTTHLELTMIHETLFLENSGPNLALTEFTVALKSVVLLGLCAQVARMPWAGLPPWTGEPLTLALIGLAALVVVVTESTAVKMRWRRLPNFLSFALVAALLACLLVALKG